MADIMNLSSGINIFLLLSALPLLLLCYQTVPASGLACAPFMVKPSHIVCVCNSSYCDDGPTLSQLSRGQYSVYTSSESGLRFDRQTYNEKNSTTAQVIYSLNLQKTKQSIIGFGGAFTDAAGINIASLPSDVQDKLISAYYGSQGIGYTIGRVPIASCDFSTHAYSYDDNPGDFNLTKFALAQEDFKFKIPFIHAAMMKSPQPLKFFASPWSAPAWLKTNNNMTGKGTLQGKPGGKYYKTWANYFVRFLEEYRKQNISFWGLTVQNEPIDGLMLNFSFQAMGFTAYTERDFIKMDLGPALHGAGFENISLMILDDQRLMALDWANVIYSDPDASKYVSGLAVHWYIDGLIPSNVLDFTHDKFPDKFIFASEACEGSMPFTSHVDLGAWDRAKSYAHDIITDLNKWVTGWTDWNLALDLQGGPNWVSNFVDSPIIVDSGKKLFYKQPMFYALGHVSKFLIPGSVVLDVTVEKDDPNIEIVAAIRPDKSIVVVVHNLGYKDVKLAIKTATGSFIEVNSLGNSIQSVIWWL